MRLPSLLLTCVFLVAPAVVRAAAVTADFTRAIRANDLAALTRLTANPAAANLTDGLKATPLHYAAIYGTPEAVRLLLSAGADPRARNQSGASPLLYAAWNFEKTRLLVEHGADVNGANNGGFTPLMVAASAYGNAPTVRYLLEHKADIQARGPLQESAVLRAATTGDIETLALLVERGGSVRVSDAAGFGPLHGITAFDVQERIRLLLAAGADPNVLNTFAGMVKKGPIALVHLSPLMLAGPNSDGPSVTALLRAGARINEVDIRKMNPLMLAIASDHPDPAVVRQLIDSGADINAKDQNGQAVLTWARKFRNPEIMTLLTKAGAVGPELPAAPAPIPGSAPKTPGQAVARTVPLLAKSGPQFFREGGCGGCHHQPMHARVFAAGTQAGLAADPVLRTSFLDSVVAYRPFIASSLPLLTGPGGDYDPLLSYLASMADLGEPANDMTDLMVHYIAVRQHPSGAWSNAGIARPPIEDSNITVTALAIRALRMYGWPARQPEFAARIERARLWLAAAQPVTTYERAEKITGLRAAGVPNSALHNEAAALVKLQRADGGWAQTPYLESDAYATGLVLHTLYTANLLSPVDPEYRAGVSFLLRTQFPDGSWYVRSRVPKFQPYFQSGFPFDHDQWISSTATSYAVMALAPAASRKLVAQSGTHGQ
jgi:ankyrin repeat protein